MKLLTTGQVVFRIAAIIALVELAVMVALESIPYKFGTLSEAVIDVTSLALLSTPLIYISVIRPFVAARDEAIAQIDHLAHVDPLTQLANRRLLMKYLERDLASSARHRSHGALLLLDLDGFKLVNDIHGHDAGDAALIEIAKRLRDNTRSEDVVCRLGGDEFVILISGLGDEALAARSEALRVAEKLISLVSAPIDFGEKTFQVGASVGVRVLGFENLDSEAAISQADSAMYRAKREGRGRAIVFEA